MGPKKKRVQWAGRVARARRRKLFGYVLKQGTLRLLRSREVVGSIPRVGSSIPSHKTKLLAVIPPLCRRCSCRGAKFSAERPPMDSARHVAPVGACPSCCERHFAALMPVVHYVCDSRATCMCARRKNSTPTSNRAGQFIWSAPRASHNAKGSAHDRKIPVSYTHLRAHET